MKEIFVTVPKYVAKRLVAFFPDRQTNIKPFAGRTEGWNMNPNHTPENGEPLRVQGPNGRSVRNMRTQNGYTHQLEWSTACSDLSPDSLVCIHHIMTPKGSVTIVRPSTRATADNARLYRTTRSGMAGEIGVCWKTKNPQTGETTLRRIYWRQEHISKGQWECIEQDPQRFDLLLHWDGDKMNFSETRTAWLEARQAEKDSQIENNTNTETEEGDMKPDRFVSQNPARR